MEENRESGLKFLKNPDIILTLWKEKCKISWFWDFWAIYCPYILTILTKIAHHPNILICLSGSWQVDTLGGREFFITKHLKCWLISQEERTNRTRKLTFCDCSSDTYTVGFSVATKIENGPKTNTKILRFLKIDRRRIRRIFVNSKILRRSSKIANSSNIFEDTKIFKRKWKIFLVKNLLPDSNFNKFSQQ